ncbi:hypothetical protein SUGI_0270160 [Cryptomeria japonica]|nr:hypothetical protein SUGI_0270160 [Cryptomeria japonica]
MCRFIPGSLEDATEIVECIYTVPYKIADMMLMPALAILFLKAIMKGTYMPTVLSSRNSMCDGNNMQAGAFDLVNLHAH